MHDPADLADLSDAPRWRVAVYWEGDAHGWMPRRDLTALTPSDPRTAARQHDLYEQAFGGLAVLRGLIHHVGGVTGPSRP